MKLTRESKAIFWCVMILVLGLVNSVIGQEKVKTSEALISIPTYNIEDNPYPVFPLTYWSNDLYPYSLLDSPFLTKETKKYRLLVLENEFLRVTVLPEVGGHLYNFYDKVNHREAVYVNHVIKPLIHGLRWGWPSGGFEFNFPHAHYYSACEPIEYSIRQNPDGSGSIFIGEVENRYGMRWQVRLTLFPGKAYLVQEVKIHNRTPLPERYHFWTINAFKTNEHTQVIFPARRMLDHSQKYVTTYPIWGGRDISYTEQLFSGGSWSALYPHDNFWCTYQHDEDAGMVHVADVRVVPGSKWFAYGPGNRSNFYGAAMSDDDGPYIEVDAGSDITQIVFRRLAPLGSHQWKEYWYPVKGLNGEIVKANENAILSLERREGKIFLTLNTTTGLKQGELTVEANGQKIFSDNIATAPLRPFSKEVGKAEGTIAVGLKDDAGKVILSWTDEPIDESKLPPEGPTVIDNKQVVTDEEYVTIHPEGAWPENWWSSRGKKIEEMSAEELYLAGLRELRETRERLKEAEEFFREALKKDPGYSLAHLELGILNLKKGLWQEAEAEFRASIARNPEQGPAFYYRGLVHKLTGNTSQAISDLFQAAKYLETHAPAYLLLGQIALASGKPEEAEDYFKNAIKASGSSESQVLLAVSYRLQKKYELAHSVLENVLNDEPINYFALYEMSLLDDLTGKGTDNSYARFVKTVNDEDQPYLELASFYMKSGLYQDAIDFLQKVLKSRQGKECCPMYYYYLGYLYGKVGQSQESQKYYQQASKVTKCNLVFPYRLEELFALEEALKANPQDWLAHYALGNFLAGRYRFSDAINEWKLALEKANALPKKERQNRASVLTVLYRNIGIILWKVDKKADEAIPYFQKSIEYADWHFQPYEDLARLYEEKGEVDKAISVAESGLNKVRNGYKLVNVMYSLLIKRGDYDRILELITKYPADTYTRASYQVWYQQCHVEKGKKLFREGKFQKALAELEKATHYPDILLVNGRGCEDFAEALWWQGLTYDKLGIKDKATECWSKAKEAKYGAYDRGQLYQAKCLMRLGQESAARKLMENILFACGTSTRVITEGEAPPWLAYLNFLQASVYEELGDMEKAKEFYTKAVTVDPAHSEPVYSDAMRQLEELKRKGK